MVEHNGKDMEVWALEQQLSWTLPDWHMRAGVATVQDYVDEATEAGLVNVVRDPKP